jgi:hypothetical protein
MSPSICVLDPTPNNEAFRMGRSWALREEATFLF